MKHSEEYEAYKKKRGQRVIIGYGIGVACLVLFEVLRNSSEVADFMEKVDRARADRALLFEVLAATIQYVLPATGISAILFTTYIHLFKKED